MTQEELLPLAKDIASKMESLQIQIDICTQEINQAAETRRQADSKLNSLRNLYQALLENRELLIA